MSPETKIVLDTLWVVLAACLVFFMNAGFGMLETGFCRAKNAVNILAKNLIVFSVSAIAFWAIGFALMFGDGNSIIGYSGWLLAGPDNSPATEAAYSGVYSSLSWATVPLAAKFFFQLAFAATAATIVSGAVAERVKFLSFIAFSFLLVAFVYPIGGHWAWGGGWLADLGFSDFAGSTVVHSVGGWAALLGAILLGPREGKYGPDGKARPIPGHNLSLATLGTFILWLGWFGFNPGSTMAADPEAISLIAVNTFMAAAAGCLLATATAWLVIGKPDLSMILNGTLAGIFGNTNTSTRRRCIWERRGHPPARRTRFGAASLSACSSEAASRRGPRSPRPAPPIRAFRSGLPDLRSLVRPSPAEVAAPSGPLPERRPAAARRGGNSG